MVRRCALHGPHIGGSGWHACYWVIEELFSDHASVILARCIQSGTPLLREPSRVHCRRGEMRVCRQDEWSAWTWCECGMQGRKREWRAGIAGLARCWHWSAADLALESGVQAMGCGGSRRCLNWGLVTGGVGGAYQQVLT